MSALTVRCIDNGDCENTLTKGKHYGVFAISATGYRIRNDLNDLIWVGTSCFRVICS